MQGISGKARLPYAPNPEQSDQFMLFFDECLQQLRCLLLPKLVAQLGWNILYKMFLRLAYHLALPVSCEAGALVHMKLIAGVEQVVVV